MNWNVFGFRLFKAKALIRETGKTVRPSNLVPTVNFFLDHLRAAFDRVNDDTRDVIGLRDFTARTAFSAIFNNIFGTDIRVDSPEMEEPAFCGEGGELNRASKKIGDNMFNSYVAKNISSSTQDKKGTTTGCRLRSKMDANQLHPKQTDQKCGRNGMTEEKVSLLYNPKSHTKSSHDYTITNEANNIDKTGICLTWILSLFNDRFY